MFNQYFGGDFRFDLVMVEGHVGRVHSQLLPSVGERERVRPERRLVVVICLINILRPVLAQWALYNYHGTCIHV